MMYKQSIGLVVVATVLAAWANPLQSASVYVLNGSFESPETSFVDVNIDSWGVPEPPS